MCTHQFNSLCPNGDLCQHTRSDNGLLPDGTWVSAELRSKVYCGIYLRAIGQETLINSIFD